MEAVEGKMRGLKLSEAERRGVKVGSRAVGGGLEGDLQAVAKLFSEKHAYAEAVANALGPIWCPMKGIECKDLGENMFLITFLQSGGWKKAVEGGPWMFDKDLMVVENFNPGKAIDDYAFTHVPIWVRVYKLPLGKMDRDTAMLIGDRVGEFLEVDRMEDNMAIGRCLRIKVRKCL
jgi:hypothetical protein